jgi:hypothetical protein
MDTAMEARDCVAIDAALRRHTRPEQGHDGAHPADDGPVHFNHLVTRRAGRQSFADLHMHVPSGWTLARAAFLRDAVERDLMAAVPGLRARIELLPIDQEPACEAIPATADPQSVSEEAS